MSIADARLRGAIVLFLPQHPVRSLGQMAGDGNRGLDVVQFSPTTRQDSPERWKSNRNGPPCSMETAYPIHSARKNRKDDGPFQVWILTPGSTYDRLAPCLGFPASSIQLPQKNAPHLQIIKCLQHIIMLCALELRSRLGEKFPPPVPIIRAKHFKTQKKPCNHFAESTLQGKTG